MIAAENQSIGRQAAIGRQGFGTRAKRGGRQARIAAVLIHLIAGRFHQNRLGL
jgi:hypothetical protein